MGCSCLGERGQSSPDKEQPKGEKGHLQPKPQKSDGEASAPEPKSLNVDLRIRPVDSITMLAEPIRNRFRFVRVLRQNKRSKLHLVENLITGKRSLIKEAEKRGRRSKSIPMVKLPLEAEIWSKFDHPHILKLYEILQDQSNLYFISEAFQGGELTDYFQVQRTLYEERIAAIMHQIFSVLVYCHQLKVILRNLSLENFVLHNTPTIEKIHIKLIGLEDSCLLSNKKPLVSETNDSHFIAPEIRINKYNEKCDIWSCGVIMYYLVLGESPYGTATGTELLSKIQRGAVNFTENLWRRLSPEGRDIMQAMLRLDPATRPTAADCLASPWMHQFARRASVNSKVVRELMGNVINKRSMLALKRAIMTFIVNRIAKPAELEEIVETFKMLDENSDGHINSQELQKGLLKIKPKEEVKREVERVLKENDENSNGLIDYTEFLILAYSEEKLLSEANLRAAFETLDRDRSKRISLEELKELLFIKGENESEELWSLVMKDVDISGDGEIDFGEFRILMSRAYSM